MGSAPVDRWEKEVFSQLKKQLPNDWIVIAGVSWSRQGPNDGWLYVRDGQADLVVLAPGLGMVVVEVKGSKRFRIGDDGRWYRYDPINGDAIEIREPPPVQATRNMHELEDVVRKKTGWDPFPGLYAYVVVYPQGKLVSPPPPLHDSSTLITQPQMHELEARLRHALHMRGPDRNGERFDEVRLKEAARLLTSRPFEIVKADTALDVRDDQARIETLTRQQFAALQGVFNLPRVAVTGPAGSGKTVLALWRLRALVEEGKRALYLCFNKDLAANLRRQNADISDHIESVDKFFFRIAKEAKLLPAQGSIQTDRTEFFRESLPSLVMQALADWPREELYDALIVDEGQDFSEDQLIAALDLLKGEDATYVFFADWRQDIFRAASSQAVGAEVVFTLHHNCRNTARINARTNRLMATHIPSMPGVPEGVDPLFIHCSDATTMAKRAWQLAHEWEQGVGAVAILSPYTLEKSCMSLALRGHGMELVKDIEAFGTPQTVYFSTIKSFKGIESASVIVVDVDEPREDSAFRAEDLYVACTRATIRLAILSRSKQTIEWMSKM